MTHFLHFFQTIAGILTHPVKDWRPKLRIYVAVSSCASRKEVDCILSHIFYHAPIGRLSNTIMRIFSAWGVQQQQQPLPPPLRKIDCKQLCVMGVGGYPLLYPLQKSTKKTEKFHQKGLNVVSLL